MKRNKHQKSTRQGVLLYPTTRFICDSSPCRVQKTENNMSQVHEQLSPETYGLFPLLPECKHEKTTYQPKEEDTNTPESLTCEDCGEDLLIPEIDWDKELEEWYEY